MAGKYLEWSGFLEIGVPRTDAEHQRLVEILNDVHALAASGAGRSEIFDALNRLVRYFEEHFASEEALMEAVGFPGLARQRVAHRGFAEKVFEFAREMEGGNDVSGEILSFLKNWVVSHVLGEDKQLEPFLSGREIPEKWRKA